MSRKAKILIVAGAVVVVLGVLFGIFVLPRLLDKEEMPSGLQSVSGELYYYGEDGSLQFGWQTIDGHRYYFDPATGTALSGWFTDQDGSVYYFGTDGWAVTGEQEIEGTAYRFNEEGRLMVEEEEEPGYTWEVLDGKTYCTGPDGERLVGLQEVGGSTYYFDPDGVRQSGWQTIEGKKYYFDENNGRAARGWMTDGTGTYYFGKEGWAVTGKQTIEGKEFTFDDEGRLVTQTGNGSSQKPPAQSQGAAAAPATPTPPPPANVPSPSSNNYTWQTKDGKTYYMDSAGNYVTGLQNIDGKLYSFAGDGARQNGQQSINGKTYFFNAETGAAEYGWQKNSDTGAVYYVGSAGYALSGVQKVGEDRYYFDADGVRKNGLVEVDGRLYAFVGDEDKAIQGWYTPPSQAVFMRAANSQPTYYFGGEHYALVGVYQLTKEDQTGWFGFAAGGEQLFGWQTVNEKRYHFDESTGMAQTNTWADDVEGKVYLGDKGAALVGLQTIDKQLYYLAKNGVRQTDWHTIEGKWYFFDTESAAAVANTWETAPHGTVYLGPEYFAVTGIQTLPHPESGADTLYGFDSNGARLTSWQVLEGKTYCFGEEGGALYGWQKNDTGRYYLGKDGAAVTSFATIGDGYYYFAPDGVQQTSWQHINGKSYLFNGEDGRAKTSWHTEGANTYYFGSEYFAVTGVAKIGEEHYYFDTSGVRRGGLRTVGKQYYAFLGKDAAAIKGWFTDVASGGIYYFGKDGYALTGPQTIDEKQYQFDANGRLKPSVASGSWVNNGGKYYYVDDTGNYVKGLVTIEKALYYFNSEGVRQTGWQTVNNKRYYFNPKNEDKAATGWFTDPADSAMYYLDEGGAAYTGIKPVGDFLYYFNSKGAKQTGVVNEGGFEYFFDPANEGKAHKGWLPDIATEGAKHYGDAGYAVTGLRTIDKALYYFDDNGVRQKGLATIGGRIYLFDGANNSAITGPHTTADGKTYCFTSDGYALIGLIKDENGIRHFASDGVQTFTWLELSGKRYYFGTDGYALMGEQTIPDTGDTYYFTDDGYALTGGPHIMGGRDYIFDDDGRLISKEASSGFDWVEKDGKWYYINSANEAKPGLQSINGFWYYFANDGERLSGWKDLEKGRYLFGEDGKAVIGWYTEGADAYYFTAEGYALTGVHTIGNEEYEFDSTGKLTRGSVPVYDEWKKDEEGNWYYYDSSGQLAKGVCTVAGEVYYFGEDGVRQSGSHKVDGSYYYFDPANDGKALRGWNKLGEVWYHFDSVSAKQLLGWQYRYVEAEKVTYNHYYDTSTGEAAISWQTISSLRRYFFPDGHMAVGWHTIDEGKYYFFENGRVATGVEKIGDVYFSFGEDGRMATGWNKDQSGNRYYFGEDGPLLGWQKLAEDGKWYLFDSKTGIQQLGWQDREDDSEGSYTHYYDASGNSPEGFADVSGVRRYFHEDGHMAKGWQQIGDKGKIYYFFPSNGAMATSTTAVDGVRYPFAEDGSITAGWQKVDGGRVCLSGQGPHRNWEQVDGVWYFFDQVSGLQKTGWQTREDGKDKFTYYYDAAGEVPTEWETVEGIRRYFHEDGHMAVGFTTLGTDTYYFLSNGRMATGVHVIDGVSYSFGSDGIMAIGWNTDEDGNRYYFTEEGALKGWQKIEKRWYYFDEKTAIQQTGWQTRTVDGTSLGYYYFSNGTLPEAGWNTSIDGTNRYVEADGQMGQGWKTIDEARYYLDGRGAAMKGWNQLGDGKWYVFDGESGVQQLGWQSRTAGGENLKYYYLENGSLPAEGWTNAVESTRRYVQADGQMAQGWKTIASYKYYFSPEGVPATGLVTIDGTKYAFDSEGRYVAPPVINSVTYNTAYSTTKTVVVAATPDAVLTNKTLQYSFDGGVTWQTGNSKSFTPGITIAAGTMQVKDSVGNVTKYNTALTLTNAFSQMKGVDVSSYQGYINWAQVKASGVDFAIIRSLHWNQSTNSYGIDPYFDYNVRNAKAYGLKVGTYLYSYAFNKTQMLEEINYFMNSTEVKNLMSDKIYFDLPVFIDYEDDLIVPNTASMGIAARTDIVRYGMALIEQMSKAKYGKLMLPGVYTFYNFGKTVIDCGALQREGYEFWLARWDVSNHGWSPAPPIWQYSSNGSVPGISTRVDVNYCYKDYSTILGGSSGNVPAPITSHNLTVTDQNGQQVTGAASSILAQIVMAEVGGFGNAELYKAQAVAAQAWIFYQQGQGYAAPKVALKAPTAAVQTAVNSVVKTNLVYNGSQAFTPYYAWSNGTTNNGAYWGNTLPYLKSVSSSADTAKGAVTGQISYGDLKSRINATYGAGTAEKYAPSEWIKVTSTNSAGYVTGVTVCGHTPTVDYFYQTIIRYQTSSGGWAYPIASPSFSVSFNGSSLWTFTSRGSGHGVGMSQYGANAMAAGGSTYQQILAHYYPGTALVSL